MRETDARLVERARAGDAEAFDELVRRHLRAAYAVALGVVAEPADAEDVCQDSFLVALERLEECREPDRFAGWLFRIVRNRALNYRRAAAVRLASPLEAAEQVSGQDSPLRAAERSELRGRLTAALAELPEVQRTIVVLHDLEGWTHRAIAELLGLPEGTVRAHVTYARRAMRERLGVLKEER